MVTGGKGGWEDRLKFWDWHVYTAIFKTDNDNNK